jgi:hypothetical protein
MSRYMVWVQTDSSEGWGCSLCDWIIAALAIDTTVAALHYNHAAQQALMPTNASETETARRNRPPESASFKAPAPIAPDPKIRKIVKNFLDLPQPQAENSAVWGGTIAALHLP